MGDTPSKPVVNRAGNDKKSTLSKANFLEEQRSRVLKACSCWEDIDYEGEGDDDDIYDWVKLSDDGDDWVVLRNQDEHVLTSRTSATTNKKVSFKLDPTLSTPRSIICNRSKFDDEYKATSEIPNTKSTITLAQCDGTKNAGHEGKKGKVKATKKKVLVDVRFGTNWENRVVFKLNETSKMKRVFDIMLEKTACEEQPNVQFWLNGTLILPTDTVSTLGIPVTDKDGDDSQTPTTIYMTSKVCELNSSGSKNAKYCSNVYA